MTDKTTRIYVDLTDEQMDIAEDFSGYRPGGPAEALQEAVKAQRPLLIAVGDRVRFRVPKHPYRAYTVEAIKDGMAWIWLDDCPDGR